MQLLNDPPPPATSKLDNAPGAFLGKSGTFYVRCPEAWATRPRYAVYSSTRGYNDRSETPYWIAASQALDDFEQEVLINSQTLTTVF